MTNSVIISPLLLKDIKALVSLVNSAYRGESSKKGWTTEADLLEGIRTDEHSIKQITEEKDSVILTAHDKYSRLVGCVYLSWIKTRLYLGMLTVAPDTQARGIGKRLLAAAEAHAKFVNCNSIVMSVIDGRHELIEWYERHGYHRTGEVKPFPSDPAFGIPQQPLQFIIMEKKVEG